MYIHVFLCVCVHYSCNCLMSIKINVCFVNDSPTGRAYTLHIMTLLSVAISYFVSLSPFRLLIARYRVGLFFTIPTTREFRRQLVVLSNMNFLFVFSSVGRIFLTVSLSLFLRSYARLILSFSLSLSLRSCACLFLSPRSCARLTLSLSLSLVVARVRSSSRAYDY